MSALCRFEDIIKLLLKDGRFGERPVGIFLVAKDDILQNRLGYTKKVRDLRVKLGALRTDNSTLCEVQVVSA
jgi:hypothetical protein